MANFIYVNDHTDTPYTHLYSDVSPPPHTHTRTCTLTDTRTYEHGHTHTHRRTHARPHSPARARPHSPTHARMNTNTHPRLIQLYYIEIVAKLVVKGLGLLWVDKAYKHSCISKIAQNMQCLYVGANMIPYQHTHYFLCL